MPPPLPSRIRMTADTVGGVWTYALKLARAFEERGIEIILATMGAPLNRGQRAEILALHNTGVFEGAFKLEWLDEPCQNVECAGEWLLKLEDDLAPDVARLNGFSLAAELSLHGFETIRARHTCAHRVDELPAIYHQLKQPRETVTA